MLDMILKGAEALGVPLDERRAAALVKYYEILIERNKTLNLTRITSPEDAVTKHFLDSLTPLLTGEVKGNVIDVGTGAGFPGLALRAAAPEISATLLDSLNKRVNFLREAAAAMDITDGIAFVHARAEDAGHMEEYRERFDTVVSRAVANMRTLSEWCLPFLKVGGSFLALKGPLAQSELNDAEPAISALGGGDIRIFDTKIPFTELDHKIVIVKKLRHTPTIFARSGGKSTAVPAEKALKRKK